MDVMQQRGIRFSRLRIRHRFRVSDVASMLRISSLSVTAFETGVILQRSQDAETKLASLMLKWEAETHEDSRL